MEADTFRGVEPGKHAIQSVAAGQFLEPAFIQRVERDIQPPEAGIEEFPSLILQQDAVRGETDVAETGDGREQANEFVQILADERFATREPHLVHTQTRRDAGEPGDLLKREQFRLVAEGHVFRHAVGAAEVAAIRDRDAEVVVPPSESIHQFGLWNSECGVEARSRITVQSQWKSLHSAFRVPQSAFT